MPIQTQAPVLYDWSGAPVSSAAAPVTNRPATALKGPQGGILTLGSDYGSTTPSAQTPKVDAAGSQYVVPITQGGTPVQVQNMATASAATAVYGQVAMALYNTQYQALVADATMALIVRHGTHATFSAIAAGVGLSTGKSLLALVNASTGVMVLRLEAVYAENVSSTTGGLLSGQAFNEVAFELRPITTATTTSATQLTIVPHDSGDTLATGITAWTGASVQGDSVGAIRRFTASNYGITPGSATSEANGSYIQDTTPAYVRPNLNAKAVTVRPGGGVHVKCIGPATVGTFDFTMIFTQATA